MFLLVKLGKLVSGLNFDLFSKFSNIRYPIFLCSGFSFDLAQLRDKIMQISVSFRFVNSNQLINFLAICIDL